MRDTTNWLPKIAGFVVLFCAALHTSSIAQEARDIRRQVRPSRLSAFSDPQSPQQDQPTRGPVRGAFGQPIAEDRLTDEPSETIALTLWVLTVTDSIEPSKDELSTNLGDRVANLPPVVGTVTEVRDLVSHLKVAGMLRGLREFRLTTLNGQSVSTQTGGNLPRVVATTVNEVGRSNTIQYEPIGTIVKLRPQIDAEGSVKVSVEYNASDMEKSTNVTIAESTKHEKTFADITITHQLDTIARLKSGAAVLLQSDTTSVKSAVSTGTETKLVILGVAVVPVLD
jgi:hypothetical protein